MHIHVLMHIVVFRYSWDMNGTWKLRLHMSEYSPLEESTGIGLTLEPLLFGRHHWAGISIIVVAGVRVRSCVNNYRA